MCHHGLFKLSTSLNAVTWHQHSKKKAGRDASNSISVHVKGQSLPSSGTQYCTTEANTDMKSPRERSSSSYDPRYLAGEQNKALPPVCRGTHRQGLQGSGHSHAPVCTNCDSHTEGPAGDRDATLAGKVCSPKITLLSYVAPKQVFVNSCLRCLQVYIGTFYTKNLTSGVEKAHSSEILMKIII